MSNDIQLQCPLPLRNYPVITMAHGGGGSLTRSLIEHLFLPAFKNPILESLHDGAVLDVKGTRLAFTTDSYVIRPLFFPGGDMGSLAVNGTVNDLSMCGARPLFLSAGFILEEGFAMEQLSRIVDSMRQAAEKAGVQIVTGDTKVVDHGKGDGIYINTAGIGVIEAGVNVGPRQVQAGDSIILNGDVGRHGIAIMALREGLSFECPIQSDCAPLTREVQALLSAGINVHCLRDLTRGGLAEALIEIADSSHLHIRVEEKLIPVREEVHGACEMLGLDPLYVANEGRFIAFVPKQDEEKALAILRNISEKSEPSVIGTVLNEQPGVVTLRSHIGSLRLLDALSGEQLPRIC
ncbi:MAG: hydrogenase expression/formation protein HypE [Lentisphaerota bacterium]